MYEVLVYYRGSYTFRIARLSVRGRNQWKDKQRAERHAQEFRNKVKQAKRKDKRLTISQVNKVEVVTV